MSDYRERNGVLYHGNYDIPVRFTEDEMREEERRIADARAAADAKAGAERAAIVAEGFAAGHAQALQEIRDRGDVIVSRNLLGRLGDYTAHATAHEETDPPHPQLALADLKAVEDLLGDSDV